MSHHKALITGGSSGIGLNLAQELAGQGSHLVIASLLEEEVTTAVDSLKRDFPDIVVDSIQVDLSKESDVNRLIQLCVNNHNDIDLLVNNAGYGMYGNYHDLPITRQLNMVDLHIKSTMKLTYEFLNQHSFPSLKSIINLSSISAFQPNPKFATYGATKAFLYNWSRSLAEELVVSKRNIHLLTVCPTPVRTQFQESALMNKSKLYDSWLTIEVGTVTREIMKALKKKRKMIIPGRRFHILHMIVSRFPESWRIFLAKDALKEKKG